MARLGAPAQMPFTWAKARSPTIVVCEVPSVIFASRIPLLRKKMPLPVGAST